MILDLDYINLKVNDRLRVLSRAGCLMRFCVFGYPDRPAEFKRRPTEWGFCKSLQQCLLLCSDMPIRPVSMLALMLVGGGASVPKTMKAVRAKACESPFACVEIQADAHTEMLEPDHGTSHIQIMIQIPVMNMT